MKERWLLLRENLLNERVGSLLRLVWILGIWWGCVMVEVVVYGGVIVGVWGGSSLFIVMKIDWMICRIWFLSKSFVNCCGFMEIIYFWRLEMELWVWVFDLDIIGVGLGVKVVVVNFLVVE